MLQNGRNQRKCMIKSDFFENYQRMKETQDKIPFFVHQSGVGVGAVVGSARVGSENGDGEIDSCPIATARCTVFVAE